MREIPATPRRSRRCVAAAVLATAAAFLAPGASAATTEVSPGELHALVQRALSDPAAVPALRRVDRVAGRPVDLRRALDGASGADLRARLRTLDPVPAAPAAVAPLVHDPGADAGRILRQRRFRPGRVPRPFRGIFRTLGRWLRPVAQPVGRAWSDLFGNVLAAGLLGGAVVGLATLASLRIVRRRSSAGVERARRATTPGRHDDPDDLERRAAGAERAGDFDLALRLRFRAGLGRLDRAGVVVDRPSLTTGSLTRQLPSARLRGLAAAFEEVTYGGRPASAGDLAAARTGWPSVLEEVAR